jgi:Luciferase
MTTSTPHENSAAGDSGSLPARPGPRPQTTPRAPHIQQDQNAPAGMQAMLAQRVFTLPEVKERSGTVAHPAERAIWLRDEITAAPGDVFPGNREIGHFHPWDGSLHIVLDPELAQAAVTAGRAEVHPAALAGLAPRSRVMLYRPRNEPEDVGTLARDPRRGASGHAGCSAATLRRLVPPTCLP